MANVARLGVVMGLDTAEFTTGLQAVDKKLESFKDRLIEFASIAAFTEMTKQAMEFADTITTTAKANDVTTASVLQLSKALEENGGSAEETGRIYSGFNQKVETAALGSAKAQESFARLGVSLKDIQQLSSQELFEKTITGLAKINDSVTRNGLAFQTLGKAIRGVDIVGLAHTIEETNGLFDKYASSVNQAHEMHLKMEASGRKITLLFTDAFIPTLKLIYDDLTKTNGLLEAFFDKMKLFAEGIAVLYAAIKLDIQVIITSIMALNNAVYAFSTGGMEAMKRSWMNSQNEARLAVVGYDQFLQKIKEVNSEAGGKKDEWQQKRDIIDALAKQLGAAQNLSKEYAAHAQLQLQMILQQRALLGLTKDQQVVQQAVNKVLDDAQQKIIEIDKQIAQASTQGAAGARLVEVYKKQQAEILKTRDIYIESTKQEVQATIDFQRTFSFGWDKAWAQFKEDAFDNAKVAQAMFDSVVNTLNSTIDNFVKTGKLSFADLTMSILADLEKIILKSLLMRSISGIGGLFGSGEAVGVAVSAFATGGEPPVGVPSLVGESGPELFIPRQAGTIIPNNQISNYMGSGGGQTINYNAPYINSMSAIDTQSAMQFLSQNKMGVWASYQSAAKSLPLSR